MIRDFEHWHSTIGEAGALKELQGTRVAIEAADYLYTRILHPITGTAEPLLPALGGAPLALRVYVERDLRSFAEYGIEPLFVFPGLDLAKPEDPFQKRERGAAINTEAWTIYASADPQEAVNKFGESSKCQTRGTVADAETTQPMFNQRTSFDPSKKYSLKTTSISSSPRTAHYPR
jgi:hypothetical protein